MQIAFKTYGESNAAGLPPQWPSVVQEVADDAEPTGLGPWNLMSVAAFDAYKAQYQGAYDAAMVMKATVEASYAARNASRLVTPEGVPVVAPTLLHIPEKARLQGFEMAGRPDQITIHDVAVTSQILVQGGSFWTTGTSAGDKCHFAIIDKNNVLGLHTRMSIPVGQPIELVRYVTSMTLPQAVLYEGDVIMPSAASIAPGLFIRTILECASGGGERRLGVLYRWYVVA